jgi:hypothetical protein
MKRDVYTLIYEVRFPSMRLATKMNISGGSGSHNGMVVYHHFQCSRGCLIMDSKSLAASQSSCTAAPHPMSIMPRSRLSGLLAYPD